MSAHASAPTICIVMGEHLTNHYAGPLARGAAGAAAALGCRLIIYSPLELNLNRRSMALADLPLVPQSADAYLLPSYVEDDLVAYCRRGGAALLTYAGARPGLPAVSPDNRQSARRLVAHLIDHGRKRIAHLLGIADNEETSARYAGYRDALTEAGLPFDPALVRSGNFRLGDGRLAVQELLAAGVAFDALFAANDLSARGALAALDAAGLRVPEDVALVGFDDSAGSETLVPPLTTVRQSAYQIGWDAVAALVGVLAEGRRDPGEVLVATELVLRASCGCGAAQLDDAADWAVVLAGRLGSRQGPLVQAHEVRAWLMPLDARLDRQDEWLQQLDQTIAEAHQRNWHTLALIDYLPTWRAQHLAAGVPAALLDTLAAQAVERLVRAREELHNIDRLQREDRLNGLTYLIDLLRAHAQDQAQEAALRHLVDSGTRGALIALGTPGRSAHVAAQGVSGDGTPRQWYGALADFPPPEWLPPGETLLLMPLVTGAQQGLIGVLERGAQAHSDLDDLMLRSINTYRSVSLLHETLRELETARLVQQQLLPRMVPPSADYDIAGAARTARQVGGDLYGYYQRPAAPDTGQPGGLALAVGDVSGKGMPAALLMSACVTMLAGLVQAGLPPGRTLSQMHQVLQPYIGRGQHTAMCLAYLDGPQVCCANAGGVAPLLRAGGAVRLLDVGGLPLGPPLAAARPYEDVTLQLAPGDMLILSSDGIIEANSEQGELYGFERFAAAAAAGPSESAAAMLAHIFADVSAFTGNAELHDDMALVVARYGGSKGGTSLP